MFTERVDSTGEWGRRCRHRERGRNRKDRERCTEDSGLPLTWNRDKKPGLRQSQRQ